MSKSLKNLSSMSVLELYEQGVINYLNRSGVVSDTMINYIDYYQKFSAYRSSGKTYRESIRLLSKQYNVSETTVKKGVRVIEATLNK